MEEKLKEIVWELFSDSRFTLSREFGDWGDEMHYVVRFSGAWIDCHDADRDKALEQAADWEVRRRQGFVPLDRLNNRILRGRYED